MAGDVSHAAALGFTGARDIDDHYTSGFVDGARGVSHGDALGYTWAMDRNQHHTLGFIVVGQGCKAWRHFKVLSGQGYGSLEMLGVYK